MSQAIIRESHELANMLPLTGVDDRAGIRESIIKSGVHMPIVKFGEKILDGRTRKDIVNELNAAGIKRKIPNGGTDPETNEPTYDEIDYECPEIQFTGTEAEALEFVLNANLHRRQLNSSQKAVVAVSAYLMGKRYGRKIKKEGGTETPFLKEMAAQDPEGDIAAYVARIGGTNRTYVFRALTLAEAKGGNAYAKKVLAGELSINAALKALKEAAEASGEGTEEGAETEVPIVLDGLKNAVAEHLYPAFAARDDFQALDQKLREVLTEVERLADGEGGAFLHKEELTAAVTTLRRNLKDNQPHTTCPVCAGTGKNPENDRQMCPLCKRNKFVSKLIFAAHNKAVAATATETPPTATEPAGEPVPAEESADVG